MLHGAGGDELRAFGAPFAADDGRVVARGGEGDCGLQVHIGALVVVVAGGGRVSWGGKGKRGGGLQLDETRPGATLLERLSFIGRGIRSREGGSQRGEKEEERGLHLVSPSSTETKI